MGVYKITKWWRKNAWRVRIRIYSLLILGPSLIARLLSLFVEAIEVYETFIAWILWRALDFVFKYKEEE